MKENQLDKALHIAFAAHASQVDKGGEPYILHPLRLMAKFTTINEQIVALLHDVIEDSDITLAELKEAGFNNDALKAIDLLTKKPGQDYQQYLEQIATNELARKIKLEDLKDNLDLTRLKTITEKDIERIKKYHTSFTYLQCHRP